MRCTSPTFVAAVYNTVSSLTFLIAILFRMEVVDVRSHRGMAKILGTLISLLGVTVITLYKGPALQNMWDTPIHMKRLSIHENWVKGSILTIASCITLSSWYIMQTFTMRKYPAELSLTAWISFIGGTQSAVFTVLVQHKPGVWSINMLGIDFWAITYCGIIGSGLLIFIQLWCMKERGPVFVSMFSPLQTVIVAVLAYFVFGEKMYTGSILGGVTVIIGLYLLLWGKDKDETYTKSQELPSLHSMELKVAKPEEYGSNGIQGDICNGTQGDSEMPPTAYFLQRKSRPDMILALFLELFLPSLIGMEIVHVRTLTSPSSFCTKDLLHFQAWGLPRFT
ncbi:hypothetical protein V6N12_058871 [Hibiscus sabdariffa]|uniref:WAT1-related protein n=1 Tax=Hibiscus sabdariffa TaxID=183260 RepID=A0ABR2ETE8_9ROSI